MVTQLVERAVCPVHNGHFIATLQQVDRDGLAHLPQPDNSNLHCEELQRGTP
jgi:hypothetical protein